MNQNKKEIYREPSISAKPELGEIVLLEAQVIELNEDGTIYLVEVGGNQIMLSEGNLFRTGEIKDINSEYDHYEHK